MSKGVKQILVICLGVAVLVSGYIFIAVEIFGNKGFTGFTSAWQFPMILAVFTHAVNQSPVYF